MSDLHGSDDEHADVRALLGELGTHRPALPDDVAARLEQKLAELVAERRRDPPRRPWGPRLLAAAAVVAVLGGLGVGINELADHGNQSASTSSASADRPAAGAAESGAGSGSTSGPGPLPRLTTSHFRRDATRLLASAAYARAARPQAAGRTPSSAKDQLNGSAAGAAGSSDRSHGLSAVACPAPSTPSPSRGPGPELLAVRVDGRPAVLAVRSLPGGRARVTAYACPGERPLASATVAR